MLKEGDFVVCAYAAPAAGPGWSNTPLWVIIRDGDGRLREECLQPHEQSAAMHALYRISAVAHAEMTNCVRAYLEKMRSSDDNTADDDAEAARAVE